MLQELPTVSWAVSEALLGLSVLPLPHLSSHILVVLVGIHTYSFSIVSVHSLLVRNLPKEPELGE